MMGRAVEGPTIIYRLSWVPASRGFVDASGAGLVSLVRNYHVCGTRRLLPLNFEESSYPSARSIT